MSRTHMALYLWPGLPQLSRRGRWHALVVALIAAVLLNAALIATFGWSELIAPTTRIALWMGLLVGWIVAVVSMEICDRRSNAVVPTGEDTFSEATEVYLKGDYYQAERILCGLLHQNRRDMEARLMLATLMRHTQRFDEAARQLGQIERIEGAKKWKLEIQHERKLLAELNETTECPVEGQASRDPLEPVAERRHAA